MPQRHHHKIIDAQAFNLSSLHALAAADVFISDYSGGLLDAVASGIPTLCFADDLDHYRPYLTDGFIDEVPCLVSESGTGAFRMVYKSRRLTRRKRKSFSKSMGWRM